MATPEKTSRSNLTGKNPALWQIFFEDKEDQEPIANDRDQFGKYVRMVDPTDEEYNSETDGALRPGAATRTLSQPSGTSAQRVEEVEINLSGKKKRQSRPSQKENGSARRSYTDRVDMSPQTEVDYIGEGHSGRFIIRTDSDLELALPGSTAQNWEVHCRYCCRNCHKWPLWYNYLIIGLGAFALFAVYLVIVLLIWTQLG